MKPIHHFLRGVVSPSQPRSKLGSPPPGAPTGVQFLFTLTRRVRLQGVRDGPTQGVTWWVSTFRVGEEGRKQLWRADPFCRLVAASWNLGRKDLREHFRYWFYKHLVKTDPMPGTGSGVL